MISPTYIAEAIYEAAGDKSPSEQTLILKNVVKFLAKRRLLSKTPNILNALKRVADAREKIISVKISSAEKLSEHKKSEFGHALKERYGAEKIHWNEVVDENLLEGVKFEIGDEVIDMSAKNKLKQLQEHLIKNA